MYVCRWNGHWRKAGRGQTWKTRVVRQQEAWGQVFYLVVDEYLLWKYRPSAAQADRNASEPRAGGDDQANPRAGDQAEALTDYPYSVDIYDHLTLARTITVYRHADSPSPALDLMRHGYLAKSPSKPTVAVAVVTLELLYRLRQRKPSYSIEAFAKVVCDYYNVRSGVAHAWNA